MPLERLPDALAVAARAADLVAETLAAKPEAVLLLPAGATPVPLYRELVRRARARTLDLSRAQLFQLDELRGVANSDPRAFHAFFLEHLVRPLALEARFHGLDGAASDPTAEIERHRRELERLGPAELVLLGLGQNGHVAFNEPGSTLADRARLVRLAPSTQSALRQDFPEGPPHEGLTLGLAEIAAGRCVALLVTGSSKAEMLAQVLHGEPTSARPATLLARHPHLFVLADQNAAARATGADA